MKRELTVITGLALALTVASLLLGGCNLDSGEDPALQLAQQAQSSAPPADSAKPPASAEQPAGQEAAAAPVETPAGESAVAAPAAKVEQKAGAGDSSSEAASGGETAQPEKKPEQPADGKRDLPPEQTGANDAQAPAEEPAAAATTEEKIENFKNLDPRDIIDKKYEDLESRETRPFDPEDPGFIPETGRIDPLTRVDSAVPDELKPPRAGETDQNEINSYLVAQAASLAVAGIAASIQCHNVIQIGLEKYASFSVEGGGIFTLQEGQGSGGFLVTFVDGIPIVASVTCASISPDQVVLTIEASGYGTPTSISKDQVYIPRGFREN